MNYKETYLKPEIAFLLKKHNYNIDKTRYMVNRNGTLVESTNELQKHYNHLECTEQEELVNDMMMLIASFSGKVYSLRAQENRKKRKQEQSKI